jgi:hypothetical protein
MERTKYQKVLRYATLMVMESLQSQMSSLEIALGTPKALKDSAYIRRELELKKLKEAHETDNYDEMYDSLRERTEFFD